MRITLSVALPELAFDFLFALFPVILLMLTLFGLFASHSVELQGNLLSYFADFLPAPAFQLLRTTVDELEATASGGMLTFGVLALGFGSHPADKFHDLGIELGLPCPRGAFVVQSSRDRAGVDDADFRLLLFMALFIVLMGGHFVEWLGARLELQPTGILLWKTIQWPAAILFIVVSYSLIYYCGPNLKERQWHWITPGSAFAALLYYLRHADFCVYLHFFNTYSAVYGSLGAVMILLVWLYVTGFAFLVGGEINAEIERAVVRSLPQ